MSDRIGLEDREMRTIAIAPAACAFSVLIAMVFAGPVVGPYWILAAWGAGAALAWAALRTDARSRERGMPGSRLRRVLGRTSEGEVELAALLALLCAVAWVLAEFLFGPVEAFLEGLEDPGISKSRLIEALAEDWRQALEKAEPGIALIGVSGVAVALLSALRLCLVLGAVGVRHGVGPWRLLGFGRGRQDWREFAARERAHRRRLLRGEASE